MSTCCPISGVNVPRFFLSLIVGFIFVFGYDMVYHGKLLMEHYEATSYLWRSPDEMKEFYALSMLLQLAYVGVLAFVFTLNYEGKGIGEGIRYGLALGIVLGVAQLGIYPYMPIPLNLAVLWFSGTVVQVVGLGVIFALLYRK